ncbi:sensor histidine kinase [Polaribacter gangjinensis]|uniref:histidine kinase n=1 Tax=Polaribacter gangjinensis TaxID=574710 RepID=A0A2S7WA78_9FLAO|nr:ATP-binding protein [Polaribacter gangjinensis]PQJ74535.1 two-component sensor histidine kinase [Polaribacter gangjinensis]
MNPLLKRQIRKYLSDELKSHPEMQLFLDAVNKSYHTFDDQFVMLQRATKISSEELSQANILLKKQYDAQNKIIEKLQNVVETLKTYNIKGVKNIDDLELNSHNLVDFINHQAKKIIEFNTQRDKLLQNVEQQNRELNYYAHMVSHDLKSPLQSINTLTSWIKEDYKDALEQDGLEKLDLIQENVDKLYYIVHGISEFSKVSKIENKFKSIALESVLSDVAKKIETSKKYEFNLPANLPVIQGDFYTLERLFFNIIDNGIKFNDKEIAMITLNFSEDETFWKFSISDNGKGIESKYFDKIFIAFKKLQNDDKSSGIGLSIVKKIIELYKGTIWLESTMNVGTTFHFTLKK